MAQYRNGDMFHLTTLVGGDVKTIFIIAKLYNLLKSIEKDGASKVILVDELEIGLDKGKMKDCMMLSNPLLMTLIVNL